MMRKTISRSNAPVILVLSFAAILFATHNTQAHVTYSGRDFGTHAGGVVASSTSISITNLGGDFGWADGTDPDLGDSHRLRAFRFTLQASATISLSVTGSGTLLPAFSIYQGLAHVSPDELDHDTSPISATYLSGLSGTQPKEGSFIALEDWKIGNEDRVVGSSTISATLSEFTYMGHAADGTSDNYGSATGINGDGLADGYVSGTFFLGAGTYSVFIGGANYFSDEQSGPTGGSYDPQSLTATLAVIPEPTVFGLFTFGVVGGYVVRRILRTRKAPY